ncbi:hypothetical protein os4_36730 (plasmid) [Comamonadaceae bacterium OS-4]|nr:hypothetical protein os4_36730 [Comamonadaceae bacterium OS-4]
MNQTTTQSVAERLFIGKFPSGIVYADRSHEVKGDYQQLAFLDYATLTLKVQNRCPDDLRTEIIKDAADLQAREGEKYPISSSNQMIKLGHALPPQGANVTTIQCNDSFASLSEGEFKSVLTAIKRAHLVYLSDDCVRNIWVEARARKPETGYQTYPALAVACGLELNKRKQQAELVKDSPSNYLLTEELLAPYFGKSAEELAQTFKIWPHGVNRLHYMGMANHHGKFYGLRLTSSMSHARFDWIGFDSIDPIGESFDTLGQTFHAVRCHLAEQVELAKQEFGCAPDGLPATVVGVLLQPFPVAQAAAG